MKARIIVAALPVCMLVASLSAQCQSWIGEAFELDTSIAPVYGMPPSDLSHLCVYAHDSLIYFMDQKAFQNAGNDYAAHICVFSLHDYHSFEFELPFPPTSKKREWMANSFWIKDLCFDGGRCAVSVQDHIILYYRTSDNAFEYDTILDHHNVKAVYFHQKKLYYLEEDHDTGYRWFALDFKGGEETLVRELRYEAPHVVQASPNRYLFHDESSVFFVSTRYPVVHKYNLDGTWVEDIRFDLPDWHPFEDEYIQKSLQVPYGVERIFATKDQIYRYSYLKVVYPIANRFLIYYTQYDTTSGKSEPMFAIADAEGHAKCYGRKCPADYKFDGGNFPFNLFQPLEDLARISWREWLVEMVADCEVSWQDLTFNKYQELKESCFRSQEPVVKIRIMRLKDEDVVSQAFFMDNRREHLSLDRLPKGKHVFILHGGLECSACSNYLSQAMNSLDSEQVHLGVLYAFFPGALQEREMHRNLRQYLDRPYDLYFLDTEHLSQYPDFIHKRVGRYPAVLFYETGKAPVLYSDEEIFDNDPYSLRFSVGFREMLDRFKAK